MRKDLLAWQWSLYPGAHTDRGNLALHAATSPLFPLGNVLVLSGLADWRLAPAGLLCMVTALVSQGRGHKRERVPPVPFDGPVDFVRRFFAEQWVTFPRFVLSGGFARAWQGRPAAS